MYQNIPTKVLTGEVRLSYCHLDVPVPPKDNPNGEKKYSVTMLLPKRDVATYQDMLQSIEAAKQQGIMTKWNGACPPVLDPVIWDGDGVRRSGEPFGEECKGHWVISAKSNMKPQVVGIDNINCELAPNDIYSGMYARVTINFFPFNSNGNRGIACGLGNVLKTRDGEPLAGGASAASDFAGIGAAPAAPAAPAYGAMPTGNPAMPAGNPAMPAAPAYGTTMPAAPTYGAAPAAPAAGAWGGGNGINPITGMPY